MLKIFEDFYRIEIIAILSIIGGIFIVQTIISLLLGERLFPSIIWKFIGFVVFTFLLAVIFILGKLFANIFLKDRNKKN